MRRGEVELAHLDAEARRHRAEDAVTHGVPEVVVDLLEPVEVDEHHRDRALRAGELRQRGRNRLDEQRAVRDLRERVVEGAARELRLLDRHRLDRLGELAVLERDADQPGDGAEQVLLVGSELHAPGRVEQQQHALRALEAAQDDDGAGIGRAFRKCQPEGLVPRHRAGQDRGGAQLVEHLLLGEGQVGRRRLRVLVVAGGAEADCGTTHLRDHHELGALDPEHRGDAVQQLARALADLACRVQDLGGAVEELIAVGTTLALAGGDLPGEHEDHRWNQCEGQDGPCRQDHQRHHRRATRWWWSR